MNGIERIAAERKRQIEQEGWSPAHDDQHASGDLATAAASYALVDAQAPHYPEGAKYLPPGTWPWDYDWWKPSDDPICNLEKAGALIAAEIDRLQRIKDSA